MSMNLHLEANLDAETKLGKKVITERFELWQTPTEVTYDILAKDSHDLIFKDYSDWILSNTKEEIENVYDEDDFFCKKDPIDKKFYHPGKDHLKELEEWLEDHKEWNIEWYAF